MQCQAKAEKIAQVRDFLHSCSPLKEPRLDTARSRMNTPLKASSKENKTEEGVRLSCVCQYPVVCLYGISEYSRVHV